MGLSSKAVIGPVSLTSTATELHAVTVDGAVPVTVTYSATPTFNFNLGNLFKITLTGDATPSFTNVGSNPRRTMFLIAQDSTGGRAFTWPSGWTNMPPVTRTASAVTAVEALFDGSNAYPVQGGRLEVDSKTINADFFGGATYAARVNAAVAYAVANGYTAVRVSQSYDASAVTFNANVQITREGGKADVIDARAYGAGSGTDDYAAIQAAWSAVGVNGIRRVWVPNGTFTVSKPTLISTSATQVEGPRQGFATTFAQAGPAEIVPSFAGGPAVFVQPSGNSVSGLVTSLATGSGNAWLPPSDGVFWNFRECKTMDLNGLSAFSIELFYKSTDTSSNVYHIIQSRGQYTTSGTTYNALDVMNYLGKLRFVLNLSGGSVDTYNGTGTVNDTATHAIEVNYSSGTVRAFLDGVLVNSVAGSGTIVQNFIESVICGGWSYWDVVNNAQNFGPKGTVDSIRFSNVARHTSNFTAPTAKFTKDANTLMLMNFDTSDAIGGVLVRADTKDGDAWLLYHGYTPGGGRIDGFSIDGVNFRGTGNGGLLLGSEVVQWEAHRIDLHNCRYGIAAPQGNAFGWTASQISAIGDSTCRYGFYMGQDSGLGHLDTFWSNNSLPIPILMLGGNTTLTAPTVIGGSGTVAHCLLATYQNSRGPYVLNSPYFDGESGSGTQFIANFIISSPLNNGGAKVTGGLFWNWNTVPPIMADGMKDLSFEDSTFSLIGATATVMKAVGTFIRPANFNNCHQTQTWKPWSDVAGTAVVGKIGKLTAIAFATPLTLDCSLRDDFELGALTGAITINFSNVTPGQKISLWTVQNAGGGNSITFGTVNTTGAVKGATANDTTASHWTQYVFDMNLAGNLTQVGFNSGA